VDPGERGGEAARFLTSGTTNKQAIAVRVFSPPSRILDDEHKERYIYSLLVSGYPEGGVRNHSACVFPLSLHVWQRSREGVVQRDTLIC
jgi:hypothetical protein